MRMMVVLDGSLRVIHPDRYGYRYLTQNVLNPENSQDPQCCLCYFLLLVQFLLLFRIRIRLNACPGPDPAIYLTAYRDPSPAGFTIILEETILHVFVPFLQLPKRNRYRKAKSMLIPADCGSGSEILVYFFRLWNRMHYFETVGCRGSFENQI